MKKIKEINWFWKNWTETEKKIYKKCAIFAIIVITIQIIAAVMCVNQFHAASTSDIETAEDFEGWKDNGYYWLQLNPTELRLEWVWTPFDPGAGRWTTQWSNTKNTWESIWLPWGQGSDGTENYQMHPERTLPLFKRMFNIIYTALLPISSLTAVTLIGYHYCMIMTSKNQRKVDDSYTSIKVVATTWLYIMLASVFITLGIQGFNTIINSKWANPIIHP